MDQNAINWGYQIPTTILTELQQISEQSENGEESEKQKQLYIALYQAFNNIINALNAKDTGAYLVQEIVPGPLFFNSNNDFNNLRPVFRTVIDFGSLPAAGSKSVAHGISGITNTFSFTRIYGSATKPATPSFIPIPYASAAGVASNLELYVDATNVTITTGGTDYSAYTICYVIVEYIKE